MVVVVVLVTGQLPDPQVSQQLGASPTHAAPPLGAVHLPALGLMEHVVTPRGVVRQHETNPGLPQVDLAAHLTTAFLALLRQTVPRLGGQWPRI